MRSLFRFIWHCLALLGLASVVGGAIVFFLLMHRTGLSPKVLTYKVAEKVLTVVSPQWGRADIAPAINPEDYPPVALSPGVSTSPSDESLYPNRQVLRVGPNRALKSPSEAAKVSKAGDIIEIDAGLYVGDTVLWQTPDLLIRGVGGRAVMDSGGAAFEGKGIWVVRADNVTIENCGFKNCRVRDRNGAGIRVEADNTTVRNCLFRENENGILCGSLKNIRTLTVEYSEFGFNGYGDGQSHGVYVGDIDEFTFQFNYVHHTKSGHHVKSRARISNIRYNYLTDGDEGNSSYAIDLEDGGKAFIIGNILHQSKYTENSALIHYGMPNSTKGETFYVVNNTASSGRHIGIFVLNHSGAEGVLVNNLLIGKLQICAGAAEEKNNVFVTKACFAFQEAFPFALHSGCTAVNAGDPLKNSAAMDLIPQFEYVHPLSRQPRDIRGPMDVGAFECESEKGMSMKAVRVCHVLHSFGTGGLEKGIATVINHGSPDIEHTILCLTKAGDSRRLLRKPVSIVELDKPGGNSIRFIGKLTGALRKIKPDVVHTRNWSGLDGVVAARLAGIRSIVHGEHGWGVDDVDGLKLKRVLIRRLLSPLVYQYTCVSRQMVPWLQQHIHIPLDRIIQVYNGIDCEQFRPADPAEKKRIRESLGLDVDRFVIGIIGRLDPVKDHSTLFKAFFQIQKKIPKAVLLVAGDGPHREALEREAGEGVLFLGNRQDISQILKALDVFVLSSLNEGISNTILEAMASGIPVIATDTGGNPELVMHNQTGFLVPIQEICALSGALMRYATDSALRQVHGSEGRRIAAEKFSIHAMVSGYETVWRRVAERHRRKTG